MHIFAGLEIGKRSIMTHQSALNITGHNVANVNTPGYTRQSPNIVTSPPWHTPVLTGNSQVGQFGTGVDVISIDRLRDRFLDDQIRNETRTLGYWDSMQESLSRLEVILNEPSSDGLRGVMDQFWESWQDLSAHPESESVRSVVTQRGMALAEAFNHTYRQLKELREDANASIRVKVDEINSIAQQLSDLNKQILSISVAGKEPNDLLDKRDLLLDQLASIADIKVYEQRNIIDESTGAVKRFSGMITVQLGGRSLVQGTDYHRLDTQADLESMNMVVWEDTRVKADIQGGELRGLLDVRGKTLWETGPSEYKELIPNLINDLNRMAKTIIMTTNDLHRTGYSLNNQTATADGTNFFNQPADPSAPTIKWAEYFSVTSAIIDDPKNIAAAATATWDAGNKINFGDGGIALQIARLKHLGYSGADASLIQNVTVDDFWRAVCAFIGVDSQEASRMARNQETLLGELENKRQSLSGVSLDEEMTNMIKFQHAYNAASRFITVIDEAIDVIVNRMGLVGR